MSFILCFSSGLTSSRIPSGRNRLPLLSAAFEADGDFGNDSLLRLRFSGLLDCSSLTDELFFDDDFFVSEGSTLMT